MISILMNKTEHLAIVAIATIAVLLVVVRANIGDNLAYTDGLHFCCQEVYPYRNQK